ncbi:three-helix bundle dimerization domain-containing protein [Arthrobacter sp. KNU-44]|uniref:three-helix bundle dimerization domain-containing protein n=1 Tax=Arthrobacter sp. KNU-44 TaxID=3450744 RepID=UPI003F426E4E
MNIEDELKAIDSVVDRLAERFPHVPRLSVEETVREEHQALAGGRIRDYVPVLVEHAARARLSR